MTEPPPIRRIAILGMGEMGAGLAAECLRCGFEVSTFVADRGARTRARAADAGAATAGSFDALVAEADLFVSVVPADQAEPLAARAAAALPARAASAPLVYLDANSITPSRAARVAALMRDAGACPMDGGIIGAPPEAGRAATRLYVSGQGSEALRALETERLSVRPLGPGETRATQMKVLFAAANKGAVALMANILSAARAADLLDPLCAEIDSTRPDLSAAVMRTAPSMPDKAGRWAIEMEDVAAGLAELGAQAGYHQAAAEGYATLAAALANAESEGLDPFEAMLALWNARGG